jgi:hypothetical protein
MSLEQLLDKYGSDKGTLYEGHQYADTYQELVDKDIKNLLEIGIGVTLSYNIGEFKATCGSIMAWLDWFNQANIYGFDIHDAPDNLKKNNRFKMFIGDQSKINDLIHLRDSIPECDVIIDDGSHFSSHQLLTFEILWSKVKPGGFYFVEDVHCKWGAPPHSIDILPINRNFYGYMGKINEGIILKKPFI